VTATFEVGHRWKVFGPKRRHDQNLVSDYITNQGMTADQAGKKWADEHESVWKAWMP
jgi:ABC-type proline/glycine betaine transport system substrate-binding protein